MNIYLKGSWVEQNVIRERILTNLTKAKIQKAKETTET